MKEQPRIYPYLFLLLLILTQPLAAQVSSEAEIELGGYMNTQISTTTGGSLSLWAYSSQLGDTGSVEVYFQGIPTGVELDRIDPSGVYMLTMPLNGLMQQGRALLELVGTDENGGQTTAWPYLNVKDKLVTLDLNMNCNPFATSDVCAFPFPSSFFQVEDLNTVTGYRMNYPPTILWSETGAPPIDTRPTNTADGCSPAGPILLHFAADINQIYLTGQKELEESRQPDNPIALFDLDTGERVMFMSEMDMNRNPNYPDRYALIIRPMVPMETAHRHVAVLTNKLRDDGGNPLQSPRAFEVLRDGILTTNDMIENVREHYEEIFAFLESAGYARDELLLAWDFMVASESYVTGSVRSMRDEALDEVEQNGVAYWLDEVEVDPNQYCARLVKGRFAVPTFLNTDNEIDYDENHHPIRQAADLQFPFTLLVPKRAETEGQPLPLVVFGHGLFGSGRGYLGGWGFDRFSEQANIAGGIMIATDWIGFSQGDLALILAEVVPNLNRITLITDRLQQSIVNNIVMTELAIRHLATDPDIVVGAHDLIDENNIHYYGVSLGGIQGSSFMSMSPRCRRGVLAVPGCGWLNLLCRSVHWNLVGSVVDSYYPDPLLQQIGIAFMQARFDHSDPVNLTRHLFKNPLPDNPSDKTVLLQESIGDSQVPNLTSEMLARAMGHVKLMTPSIYDVAEINTTVSPTTEPCMVQYHMVEQAEANMPPDSNVPPATDNGVHSDIFDLDHVMEQAFEFITTGNVVQTCTGPCDPD